MNGRNDSMERTAVTRPRAVALVSLLALVPSLARIFLLPGFYSDDPFIIFVYARNLAERGAFTFNLSEPTLGVTCPLWVLILAVAARLGAPLPETAAALGCCFASLSVALMYIIVERLTRNRLLAVGGAALIAADCWLLKWAGTGMETPLAVLLVEAFLFACWGLRDRTRRALLLGAFSALAWLTRPECGLLMVIALALALVPESRSPEGEGHGRRRWIARLPATAAVQAAIALPWLVFAWTHFGRLTPQTLTAKKGGVLSALGMIRSAGTLGSILAPSALPALAVIAFFLIAARGRNRAAVLGKLAPALLFAAGVLFFFTVIRFPIVSRYLAPLTPVWVASAMAMLPRLADPDAANRTRFRASFLLVVASSAALSITFFAGFIAPNARRVRDGMQSAYREAGEWLGRETEPDARVALNDIGLMAYYARREVLDLAGLVTPGVGRRNSMELLRRERPDYLVGKIYENRPPFGETARILSRFTELASWDVPTQSLRRSSAFRIVIYRCRWDDEPPPPAGGPRNQNAAPAARGPSKRSESTGPP